jgi:transcriptional regulator with XRE-family HTH domain
VSSSPGQLIRQTRRRYGLSQRQLALRSGSTQAAVSRLERDELSSSVETLDRMLLAMGERLSLGAERIPGDHDPVHLAAERRLAPDERLARAFQWAQFNNELLGAARRQGR